MSSAIEPEIVYDKQGNAHEVVDFNNDYEGAKLGFWTFLLTEVMIFGSLFLVYGFYFYQNSEEFVQASEHMNRLLGGINTFVLLVSTLTMGLALVNLRNGKIKICKRYIWITIILAAVFLIIKYNEWMLEIGEEFYPSSPYLDSLGNGVKLFFGLYFSLTGLHGIHIIVGIGVMLWILRLIDKGEISSSKFVVLENTALYWDFVHIVWIIVFPIFYLIY
jgi:cytochrome c oxidase subunit 3